MQSNPEQQSFPLLTNTDGYSRDDEVYFAKLKPKRFGGDLDEGHFYYFSDAIDIMVKEKDLSRKKFRLRVFLHGSKEKNERPFYQLHNDVIASWTSSLRAMERKYNGVQSFVTG